tara:strand:- start:1081 stop:1317 length:237 start_codon:yes stop_codon:yes gene_type:complete
MKIEVKLVGRLREYRDSKEPLEITDGVSVEHLVQLLKIPAEEAGMVAVNDNAIPKKDRATTMLNDGDSITMIAPVHGG